MSAWKESALKNSQWSTLGDVRSDEILTQQEENAGIHSKCVVFWDLVK